MAVTFGLIVAAALLPLAPHPAAPFPRIITDAVTVTRVAPGIAYGEYRMRTADGPLSIHVLALDPGEKTIRIAAALASERLVSNGETLSSMAHRNGAVAGINADYFDINQTNMPLNLLVENGRYVRAPMQRPVFAITNGGIASIAEYSVQQTASFGEQTFALAPQNDWPPRGPAAMLITPAYGPLRASGGVTLFDLAPQGASGSFDVLTQTDASQPAPAGYYFALGPDADPARMPPEGQTVTVSTQAVPSLDDVWAAAGGGPLLVKGGKWFADPHGPSSGEFATHMPASAVGLRADGTIVFLEIDGRQPALSIGVLQPQIAALAISFEAQTAMQFDGGGSSTMVARLPGDAQAEVVNSPSDGTERRIADALLVYSDAPHGSPVRIETRPQIIRAVPGASSNILAAEVDAAGHTITAFSVPFTARAGESSVTVSRDGLQTRIPVEISSPASVDIVPNDATVESGGRIMLSASAFDSRGYPMLLPQALAWQTDRGRIDARGELQGASADAHVRVAIAGTLAQTTVTVGRHAVVLPFASQAAFATAPAAGPGSLQRGPCADCVTLSYDFSAAQRAAYANVSIPLGERALGVSADVEGDGRGETLRAAVENAIHERFLLTFSRVDWRGWRHVELRLPAGFAQPGLLRSIYVVAKVGNAAGATAPGSVTIRNVCALQAGSTTTTPK